MLVTIVITTLVVLYAAFVIFRAIKKRRDAKKSGKPAGCPFCSGKTCAGCEKKD